MSTKVKPFNQINVRASATRAAQFVQDKKIELSRKVITEQQYAGRFPDEYVSYSGTVGRNPFRDPETFFRVMRTRAKDYRQRFTFLPAANAAYRKLLDAAELAYRTVIQQAYRYGVKSGNYRGSFILFTRQGATRTALTSLDALENATQEAIFEILSPLAYASTVEANALYHAQLGGVLYHAAEVVRRAYPNLAVRYVYHKAAAFNLPHKYDVPVLSIGSRESLRDKVTKPGKNYRRRQRLRRARGN